MRTWAAERIAKNLGSVFLDVEPESVDLHSIKPGQSVFIWGPVGSGKTQLAVALLMLANKRCQPQTVTGIIQAARTAIGDADQSERVVVRRYEESQHLLLDDLGVGLKTPYALDVIGRIIDHRWSNKLPTLITSNLSLDEIAEQLDDRIASRIAGFCKVVHLITGDRRLERN